ncbi:MULTISPECIES: YlbF family regulator [Carnobacterium]|uniref:YlbF family regulator n=1 Tax=Carnobacterium TaxID=2747 RepID=UPI000550108D|nr:MULTISPECIES: YlbF family regulator [Carnobacterium]
MNNNIYDTANQLEQELRTTEAYADLKAAFDSVKNNAEANEVFQQFQEIQMKLQQKQMSGEEILEEEIKEAQEMALKSGDNAIIKDLMEAEQKLSTLIDDLNRIIMKPVQDIYQG